MFAQQSQTAPHKETQTSGRKIFCRYPGKPCSKVLLSCSQYSIYYFNPKKLVTLPFIILVQTQIWPIKHAFKEAVRSKHVQGPALCKRSFYLDITPCLGRNAVSWEQGMRKIQNTIHYLQKNNRWY